MARLKLSARRITWGAAAFVFVIWVLNVPFYAGQRFDSWRWRMEHGRLTLRSADPGRPKSFWLDANSEGLKFAPELWLEPGEWMYVIPLWMPFGFLVGLALFLERRARRSRSHAS